MASNSPAPHDASANPGRLEPLAVDVKEASRLIAVSDSLMWELIRDGEVESKLIRSKRVVLFASLKGFLERQPSSRADHLPARGKRAGAAARVGA